MSPSKHGKHFFKSLPALSHRNSYPWKKILNHQADEIAEERRADGDEEELQSLK
jgi:hypothetical protein